LQRSCILRFDGASRGNPGPAGAGAALFTENGVLVLKIDMQQFNWVYIVYFWNAANSYVSSQLYRFREGLGYQTNNAAEYRALILGLNQAFYKGYKNINVQGDSLLVVNQVGSIIEYASVLLYFSMSLLSLSLLSLTFCFTCQYFIT
jgi:ribonuclease HI